ncbi:MAG: ATP-binding protein [Candidatus Omnitrophota bacterium]
MKIAYKISLSFFVIVLIIVGIAMSIFYIISKDILRDSICNKLNTVCYFRSDHIKTYLNMLEISVGQLSKSVAPEDLLKINSKGDPRQADAFEQIIEGLKETKEVNSAIDEILLLDKTGKVVASSNAISLGADKSNDTYFLNAQKRIFIKDIYFSEIEKRPLITVSTPLLNNQTGELLGVFVLRNGLEELYNIVTKKTGLGNTGEIYIVNRYGFMITPSRFKEVTVLKQKVDTENLRKAWMIKDMKQDFSQVKWQEKLDVFPNYRGVEVLGAHEYIPQMQWTVLAEIDVKEAFKPLAHLYQVFIVLLLIVFVSVWILDVRIAKLITEPLHRLHKGTEIIGSGNLDYKVGTKSKDEVGQLSRSFDTMMEDLKKTTVSIESLKKEIIERKRIEGYLRDSEIRYRGLFQGARDAIMTLEPPSWRFSSGNPETIKMFMLKDEADLISYKPWYLSPELQPDGSVSSEKAKEMIEIALSKGSNFFEWKYKRLNGEEFPANVLLSKMDLGGRIFLQATVRDITESKRAEDNLKKAYEELKQAQTRLIQSEKMASIGQLAAGVAHEINNPMAFVISNISILDKYLRSLDTVFKRYLDLEKRLTDLSLPQAADLLQEIQSLKKESNLDYIFDELPKLINESANGAQRVKKIVQDLLTFSTIGEAEEDRVNLNEIMESVLSIVGDEFKPKAEVIKEYADIPLLTCCPQQISQVFINLLTNAVQAIKDKGEITIKTYSKDADIFIEISDTGSGISEESLKRIFDPFFTTKPIGTGLGLSMVYNIIQKHKGEIIVKSKVGIGTNFIVRLPVGSLNNVG